MCGSCAMTVNGRPRWTCRTHVSKVAGKDALTIGPLENLPIIKDLATDMRPFFEKWQQARGAFTPSRTRKDPIERIAPDSPARAAANAAIECINCGVCHAACDTVRWNPGYLGPAALNRAWTLVNDVRDSGNSERLSAVAADGGCHNCHSHQSCQEHCPVSLNPTASIAGLKRRTSLAYLRGEIKP
jgi:fumarate reductase iron-sulfur subunit